MSTSIAIDAINLVKTFKLRPGRDAPLGRRLFGPSVHVDAVAGLSLAIDRGETVGCVGSNGAGKSTTVKMLTGLLLPTAGSVRINGLDPWKDRRRCARTIGVVFGQRSQLVPDTPLRDSFDLIRCLYTIPRSTWQRRLDVMTEMLDMGRLMDTPARSLSLGERMRGDFIAAMLPSPPVLFLDEPTIGLDGLAKQRIYDFLEQIRRDEDLTILLTSHDMRDIERLCARIVVIDRGQLIYDGDGERLKAELAPGQVLTAGFDPPSTPPRLDDIAGITSVERLETGRMRLTFDPILISPPDLIAALMRTGRLIDLKLEEPSLDEVVRGLYEQQR